MIDIASIYNDYDVDVASSGHKHQRDGWIQVECPFCSGNPGYHLGFHLSFGYFNCWRCGYHTIAKCLMALLNLPYKQVAEIIKDYEDGEEVRKRSRKTKVDKLPLIIPNAFVSLTLKHHKYLRGRGFVPEEVERMYQLRACGPIGEFKHRIIAPIILDGEWVSWQGRDFTGKSGLKYLTLAEEKERVHHKHICYGVDLCPKGTAIIVEGVVDAWKLGPGAIATFGIEWTVPQLSFIASRFQSVAILYDAEVQAQKKARELEGELSFLGLEVLQAGDRLKGTKDPGDLPLRKARQLGKNLLTSIGFDLS